MPALSGVTRYECENNEVAQLMMNIGVDDLLEHGMRGSGASRTEGDLGCSSGRVFLNEVSSGRRVDFWEDLVWRKLLDGLNDVKVSKGVLGAWTRVTILMRVNL